MTFWIVGGSLTALTAIALLSPALKRSRKAEFTGRAQAVYTDQLAEVGRDETVGLLSAADAEAARSEIKRRMLKAARDRARATMAQVSGGHWALILAAVLVPVVGVGSYLAMGTPNLASAPFAGRIDERNSAQSFQDLISRLRERLVADQNVNADGWLMLTQTYLKAGRPSEAAWAMETMIARGGAEGHPEYYSLYAEALIEADNGIVSPKAEAAIDTVLAVEPGNVAGVYYKSLALEQSGDTERAFAMLRDRVNMETSYQPWMETVGAKANALAASLGEPPVTLPAAEVGPSGADVAAAADMSSEDRSAFIRSMVARLADRLKREPDDLDGWLKLANAYSVLGETQKSLDAYEAAEPLSKSLPASDPRRQIIAEALSAAK